METTTCVRIEKAVVEQAKKICQKKGTKLGWFVAQATKEKLERDKSPKE